MAFEGLKSIFKSIMDYRKKKKEEKEVFYMQASGASMIKKSNFQDHAYMKSPIQQMGLDKGVKLGSSQFGSVNKK